LGVTRKEAQYFGWQSKHQAREYDELHFNKMKLDFNTPSHPNVKDPLLDA
jgi:hypothetical protein